jgi:GTP-binding protein Era
MDNLNQQRKCGFVAILGLPNAGKSTLINQMVGHKVSIVSPKVQTTRRQILAITVHAQSQIILVDTPGIFDCGEKRLDKAMVDTAWMASKDADINLVLLDVNSKSFAGVNKIIDNIKTRSPIFLVLNKIDTVKREKLLEIVEHFKDNKKIEKVFMISALYNDGVHDILSTIGNLLPDSPWLYPDDQLTNLPQRIWSAEITREQLYMQLQHELPYETYVETETWEEFNNGSIKIRQAIIVARDGQKGIILGKNGSKIKNIGKAARQELQNLLGKEIHLILFVKVMEDWISKPWAVQAIGIE